jgi:predicted dehydrogenase
VGAAINLYDGDRKEDLAMRKLRWGLIGCGDISRKRVAPALRDLDICELVAVNRARAELAESFAREFGAQRWYANWRELIADNEIDAVYVATPVYLHAEQTIAAAEAGKHVLCEKPMAMNTDECDRMMAACRANNVKLGIAYYRHFYPLLIRIKKIIASGEIGKPVLAQVNAFERFNPQPGDDRHWLLEKAQSGGGPMMDFGCHRIEILLNLFGPIRRTTSLASRTLFAREVEDTCVANFEFENAMQGVLAVSHASFESQDTVDIYGSEGSLHIPVLNRGELRVKTVAGERTEQHPPHQNIHLPLIEDFTRAVLEEREPKVGGVIGREVARIEEAIYAE